MKKITLLAASALVSLAAAAASPAQYPGGEEAMNEFIAANLAYPAPAKANGIEGVISLQVTIKADGSIGPVKVVRMIDPDLEQEAIRIVRKMPAWTPATTDSGAAVDSTVPVQVAFIL